MTPERLTEQALNFRARQFEAERQMGLHAAITERHNERTESAAPVIGEAVAVVAFELPEELLR